MSSRIISFTLRRKKAACPHTHIVVDGDLWRIECDDCGETLDPIAFLVRLANDETDAKYRVDMLRRAEERIRGRLRTKCEHCGRMTRIER